MLSGITARAVDRAHLRALERISQNLETFGQDAERRRLEELDALYLGDPYALDPELDDWEDEDETLDRVLPIWKRRPGILTCEGRKLVERALSMLFGRGRFPSLAIHDESGDELVEETKALQVLLRQVRYWSLWLAAGRQGLGQGSAVAAFYVPREQALYRRAYAAKECVPTFGWDDPETADRHGIPYDDLVQLEIRRLFRQKDEVTKQEHWYLWRRVLTPTETIDYVPVRADQDLDLLLPEMRRDEPRCVTHGLGFVPAVWVKSFELDDSPWGGSLLDGLSSMLKEIDYLTSQRARANRYAGEPALCPASAQDAEAMGTAGFIPRGSTRYLPAQHKFVEMQGTGQVQQRDMVEDLRRQIGEVAQVYIHDPRQTTGALSGVAMEQLHGPTVGLIDELRGPYGEGVVRLAEKIARAATKLRIGTLRWKDGWEIVASWPPIFPPNAKDAQEASQAAATAVGAGFLSRRTAIDYMSAFFGIEAVEGEYEQILKEQKEMAAQALDDALARIDAGVDARPSEDRPASGTREAGRA